MRKLTICLGSLLLFSSFLSGQITIDLDEYISNGYTNIGSSIEYLEDTTGKMAPGKVFLSQNFQSSTSPTPNFGPSKSTFWFRFKLKACSNWEDRILEVRNPSLNVVNLYELFENNHSLIKSGEFIPYSKRPYQIQNPWFDIKFDSCNHKQYFLEVKSTEEIAVPIRIGKREAILAEQNTLDLLCFAYILIVIVLSAYNVILYFSTGQKIYLHYVGYCITILLAQLMLLGYTTRFLFSELPQIANMSWYILSILSGMAAYTFATHFLKVRLHAPVLYKIIISIVIVYGACMIPVFLKQYEYTYNIIVMINGFMTIPIILIMAISAIRKGFKPAVFFSDSLEWLYCWCFLLRAYARQCSASQ